MFPQPFVPFIREADLAVRRPWYTPPRRLLDYLLLSVQEGECIAEVEGDSFVLLPGDICLIQSNTLHSLRGATNTVTPYLHLDLFYNPRRDEGFPTRGGQVDLAAYSHLVQPRLDDLGWIDIPVLLDPVHPAQFQATVLRIVEMWQSGDLIAQMEANHLATSIFLGLLKQYRAPSAPNQTARSLHWIPSFLSVHVSESLTVADMASRANLSPSRFAAVFRQEFGTSPHQYFLGLRIEHAQELLRATGLPLHDVAAYCGFGDVHHFAKAFKKITGVTPGTFRRQ